MPSKAIRKLIRKRRGTCDNGCWGVYVSGPHRPAWEKLSLGVHRAAWSVLARGSANSLALFIFVEQDVTFVFHKLAKVVVFPQRLEHWCVRISIVLPDEIAEVLRRFGSMIEWHFGEEMVDDVVVGYIMQEKSPLPSQEVTVHCAGCAALKGPFLLAEVWQLRVGVMEICDHDEPMGDSEPGYTVIFYNIGRSEKRAGISDKPGHGKYADIRENNGVALAGIKNGRRRIEMICPLWVLFLSGDVEEKISREREKLLP